MGLGRQWLKAWGRGDRETEHEEMGEDAACAATGLAQEGEREERKWPWGRGQLGRAGGDRPAGPEAEKGGRVWKNSFLCFLNTFSNPNSNSFANFNQTKASQNKYASA